MQHGARALSQGKKGTAEDTEPVGFRCQRELFVWLGLDDPATNKSGRVTDRLKDMRDIELEAGDRMREIRALKEMEGVSLGRLIGRLMLEGYDARRKGKK